MVAKRERIHCDAGGIGYVASVPTYHLVVGFSRAALLFRTTWTVNPYVVAAILAMTLFANFIASRVKVNPLGMAVRGPGDRPRGSRSRADLLARGIVHGRADRLRRRFPARGIRSLIFITLAVYLLALAIARRQASAPAA